MKRPANVAAEIVLTGGPGGGKSSAMSYLQRQLTELDYRVLIVPELATMFILGGVSDIGTLAAEQPERYLDVQTNMILGQRDLRSRFLKLAESFPDEKVILLHDRGTMDNRAYMTPEQFDVLLQETGLSLYDVRDSYDAVLHLVTAAAGAEEFYTLENNAARMETPEQARAIDAATLQAWVGHPHLRIIGNDQDFEAKLKAVFQEVAHLLGVPEPLEIERKFLLAAAPEMSALADATAIEIEQSYITNENPEIITRVRKRSQKGQATYYLTEKRRVGPGKSVELERIIKPREYLRLLASVDPSKSPVKKTRYCFAHEGSYFELDDIREPQELWLLEVELTSEGDEITLPDFLEIEREVTDDPAFKNENLAAILSS